MRRGFKGKLTMSSYRAPKSAPVQVSTMVKPPLPPTTASMSFGSEDELALRQKASSVKKEGIDLPSVNEIGNAGGVTGDDSVDERAAAFISYVQDRFKREQRSYLTMSLYRAPKSAPVQVSTMVKPPTTASMSCGSEDELALKQIGDDSIDERAAAYISYVQNRFKREQVDYKIRKYY
uniref:Uncharacterized protein n=1 Tax=Ananas comosus var. bracteatus TaxID=296719 RepID=A0A6V7QUA0_ANACO